MATEQTRKLESPPERWVRCDRRSFLVALGLTGLSAITLASACAGQPEPAAKTAAPEPKPAAAAPQQAAPAKPADLREILVSLNNPILNVAVNFFWIGNYLGYYAQEGLAVKMQGANGATEATNLLGTGKTDFGPPPPSAVVQQAAAGRDLGLSFVYCYVRSPIHWFAVNPDSPIKDLPDLVGKKIGVASLGDEGVSFTKATMRELGKDPGKDVQIVATGVAAPSGQAMQKGEVDAICMSDAQFASIEAVGITMRYLPYPKFYKKIFSNYIATRKEVVQKDPKMVTGYLRGLSKSITFFMANPEASIRIHWKVVPEGKPKGLSEEEAIKQALVGINYRIPRLLGYGKENLPMGEETAEDWEEVLDYAGVKGKVDASKFYTNEFIKEANNYDRAAIMAQAKSWKE
ncbi:MAG: ABC transporter substrate-binding protein [Chloroflexi bacterium]|nr:ABC transporter substrate-binding protein [Chloroflexota bacterium]